MKVLSLFDGISCGHVALDRAGISVEKYYASEIEKNAIKITQKNYPDTVQLGDVTKITENQLDSLGKIDMVIGGSPCFCAGTKIFTDKGYKNIEDICVGDFVLTHRNRFRKVTAIGKTENVNIGLLKSQGSIGTYVTPNHPYLTLNKKESDYNEKWLPASDLKHNENVLGIPNNFCYESKTNFNLDEETCWLLGRYVADGHIRNDKRKGRKNSYHYGVVYSIGDNKLNEFLQHLNRWKCSTYRHSQSVHRCVINSKELVEFILSCGFGTSAITKTIPIEILGLPDNLLESFLSGYLSGDVTYYENIDIYGASTISYTLALSLQLLVSKLYKTNANIYFEKARENSVICGRKVKAHDQYTVRFSKVRKKQNKCIVTDSAVWYPFKSYEIVGNETVYNMTVDEDNSYTANNFIVHNCQDLSNYKYSMFDVSGLRGNSSRLFYDYIRILKYINPKYFLLENVASMEDRWKDAMSEIIGCYPIMINSSDFCAAERKRYYWTNIPIKKWIPKDIVLKDIIFDAKDVPEKYWYTKYDVTVYDGDPKIKATLHLNSHRQAKEVYSINHKCNTLLCDGSGGNLAKKIYQDNKVRKLMPIEYERLQTLPDNYTDGVSDSARYTAIGNGWTVDVIAHILSGISLTDTKDCYFCGKYVKKRLF